MTKQSLLFAFIVCIAISFTSCLGNKRLTNQAIYFRNVNDSILLSQAANYDPVLQKGDILSIEVTTADEATYKMLNQNKAAASTELSLTSSGYLIDTNGEITLPMIGNIPLEGKTKTEARNIITKIIRERFANDAVVSVRLINFKITVLGEVARPSSYSIPGERVSILEAIGLAGDLTVFGRRDNIKIFREVNGRREVGTINLSEGKIFDSPYYYLRQNDVVYVEMNNRKIANADQSTTRNASLILGVISAVSLIITAITRF